MFSSDNQPERVKYPPVDPKSVDGASREEQIQGYSKLPDGRPDLFFMPGDDGIVSGKGVPQTERGGFLGRPHGWDR